MMPNPLWSHPGLVIAVQLVIWSCVWMAAAVIGLWRASNEQWRSFWLVNGIWCAVDAAIGIAGLVGALSELPDLRRILLVNAGLDVLYVGVGLVLATRRRPALRGTGMAIGFQGAFLLIFDLYHGLSLPAVL